MFITQFDKIVLLIGSVIAIIYVILILASEKYKKEVENLDEKEFPLHELYTVGMLICKLVRYNFASEKELEKRKQLAIYYGENADLSHYQRVYAAQKITISSLLFVISIALYGFTKDIAIIGVMMMFVFVAYYYSNTLVESRLKKASADILSEFPNVVSKLALLINAGMIMKDAWRSVAEGGNGKIYDEMKVALVDIDNGFSELDAYMRFANRCMIPEIKKFISTVSQGIVKGNSEFAVMIRQQSDEVLEIKRHNVRRQGERAGSLLLIPIMVMFIGVIIMIVVPIFLGIGS